MPFTIEYDREEDGRWIAGITELPGVLVYGETQEEATNKVLALTFRVLADRIEHGEMIPTESGEIVPMQFSFVATP